MKHAHKGFTLVELMITTLLIVLIVSMVYTSYAAASRSSTVYKQRLSSTQQAHLALQQIASLIQGCFIPLQAMDCTEEDTTKHPYHDLDTTHLYGKKRQHLFYISAHETNLIRLITTKVIVHTTQDIRLWETILRHDPSSQILYLGQRSMFTSPEKSDLDWTWEPLLTHVESIQFTAFDGKNRHEQWDILQGNSLPNAVTMRLTVMDDRGAALTFKRTVSLTLAPTQRHVQPKTFNH